ncbi:hypothetical protein MMC24_006043 [Lignoscripta atroalba]|nr:hypothetical protein [Lignoscripta atroalba]
MSHQDLSTSATAEVLSWELPYNLAKLLPASLISNLRSVQVAYAAACASLERLKALDEDHVSRTQIVPTSNYEGVDVEVDQNQRRKHEPFDEPSWKCFAGRYEAERSYFRHEALVNLKHGVLGIEKHLMELKHGRCPVVGEFAAWWCATRGIVADLELQFQKLGWHGLATEPGDRRLLLE